MYVGDNAADVAAGDDASALPAAVRAADAATSPSTTESASSNTKTPSVACTQFELVIELIPKPQNPD